MDKNKPLPSLGWQLTGNIVLALLACLGVSLVGDFEPQKILARTGLVLCLVATLLAAYRIIFQNTFNTKLNELFERDSDLQTITAQRKLEIHTNEEMESILKSHQDIQNNIYHELSNTINLGEREIAHIKLSLVLITIGSLFQIAAAT